MFSKLKRVLKKEMKLYKFNTEFLIIFNRELRSSGPSNGSYLLNEVKAN